MSCGRFVSRQQIPAEFLDGFAPHHSTAALVSTSAPGHAASAAALGPSSGGVGGSCQSVYPVNDRGVATIVTQPKGRLTARSMTLPARYGIEEVWQALFAKAES